MELFQKRLRYLLGRHTDRLLTPEEAGELSVLLGEQWQQSDQLHKAEHIDWQGMLQGILGTGDIQEDPIRRIHLLKTGWFRYAAIVLLVVGIGSVVWVTSQRSPAGMTGGGDDKVRHIENDILPGGNKAILILADGSRIVLDSAANGTVAEQGGTKIVQREAGRLAYQGSGVNSEAGYNTIATPKGGQYQVELPDGSKAWLNAASSVRFPTVFEKERNVTVTGEVYFEIAGDKNKPFEVVASGTAVQVLGTSFNVNAYTDEAGVRVSLVNGVVKVAGEVLKPGQAYQNGRITSTDTNQDIAWKNGVFDFNKVPLQQAMRQIAKWYDVEVVYEKGVPNITFYGETGRELTLEKVLLFLKDIGVHSRLEGRRITIYP